MLLKENQKNKIIRPQTQKWILISLEDLFFFPRQFIRYEDEMWTQKREYTMKLTATSPLRSIAKA